MAHDAAMKTPIMLFPHRKAAILMAVLAASVFANAQVPPASSLNISPGPVGSGVRVTIDNPGSRISVIPAWSDLAPWTGAGVWKVYSGSAHGDFNADGATPLGYFRAVFDPEREDVAHTTENALGLPEASFNYAAPVLPP